MKATEPAPKIKAAAPLPKLNIRKRYGKSGVIPAWVYDLPLKHVLKAGNAKSGQVMPDQKKLLAVQAGRRAGRQVRNIGMLLEFKMATLEPAPLRAHELWLAIYNRLPVVAL